MKKISTDIQHINEYRDRINSGLFQIYKVLTANHTDCIDDIDDIIKMRQMVNTKLEILLSKLFKNNQ